MCTQYLHYIDPPTPYHHIPPVTDTNPHSQDLFLLPVLQFCKRKKKKIEKKSRALVAHAVILATQEAELKRIVV
jgi:hypothetical protein